MIKHETTRSDRSRTAINQNYVILAGWVLVSSGRFTFYKTRWIKSISVKSFHFFFKNPPGIQEPIRNQPKSFWTILGGFLVDFDWLLLGSDRFTFYRTWLTKHISVSSNNMVQSMIATLSSTIDSIYRCI